MVAEKTDVRECHGRPPFGRYAAGTFYIGCRACPRLLSSTDLQLLVASWNSVVDNETAPDARNRRG